MRGGGAHDPASRPRAFALSFITLPVRARRAEEELRATAEQLTIVRRARMTDLYTTEREECVAPVPIASLCRHHRCSCVRRWQSRLAEMGLTIEPTIH